MRTVGLVDLKILRACGVFHSKHGYSRALLKMPNTYGVIPEPRWLGQPTLLTDALCIADERQRVLPESLLCSSECVFQLNYSPQTMKMTTFTVDTEKSVVLEMSRLEQAVCSEDARGYQEHKLICLFRTCRRKEQHCLFDVTINDISTGHIGCEEPVYVQEKLA